MGKFIKRFLIVILVCLLTYNFSYSYDFGSSICEDTVVYKYSTARINVIDPSVQNNTTGSTFPGHRGANQLVIYTRDYGSRTGTNEFGTEAIVENGFVVSLSGADSIIPKNGFVISGHGRAKEWINQNVTLGSKILVDDTNMTITSYFTPDSFLFATKEKVKEVLSIMKYYSNERIIYDYTSSADFLNKTKKSVKQSAASKKDAQKYSVQALENANQAIMYSLPYYEKELKGVWIRPTQKTQSEISNTLDRLKNAGINNIFLESYYHGKTIYPSLVLKRYNITNQHEFFVGTDPLKIWVNEAHKRNMKVHIWFESFYVGNENPQNNPNHILSVYPQWANTTKKQYDSQVPVSSANEHNGYFLDPANPMVQNYLLEVINEIISNYHPDGINLDYIRYPQTVDRSFSGYENHNWGYTQFARDEFTNMYEIDPLTIDKNTYEWALWAKYRQDKVSSFVRQVKATVGNKAIVTAVIFPDRRKSLDTKMQDWSSWSRNNYIDGFTPLILSCDYQTAKKLLNDIKMHSYSNTDIYMGIFVTFMNGSTDDLLKQIHLARQLETKGVIIFDYNHFTQKYIDAVSLSAFKPLDDKSVKKFQTGEISQQKLRDYLAKTTKEFNSDPAFYMLTENKTVSKKKETEEAEKFIKEINSKQLAKDRAKERQQLEKEQKRQEKERKKLEKKRKKIEKNLEKLAPEIQQGEKGRFF